MRIEQVMTRDVISVSPDTPLKEVARMLTSNRISGLPVCEADGTVVGVVSELDILRKEQGVLAGAATTTSRLRPRANQADRRAQARTAGEAMTAPAVTIEPRATVAEAARLMVSLKVNRLPVLDESALVGIVTRADLIRAFERPDEEIEREIVDDLIRRTFWLDPSGIDVSVTAGEVVLSGELDRESDTVVLEALVARVPGVVTVRSELTWTFGDREVLKEQERARAQQRLRG
jgi:CBS domain-containing protein